MLGKSLLSSCSGPQDSMGRHLNNPPGTDGKNQRVIPEALSSIFLLTLSNMSGIFMSNNVADIKKCSNFKVR